VAQKDQPTSPLFNISEVAEDGGLHLLMHGGALLIAKDDFTDGKRVDATELVVKDRAVVLTLTEAELGALVKTLLAHVGVQGGLGGLLGTILKRVGV